MIPRRPTREDLVGRPFPTSRIIAVEHFYQHPLCASDHFSGYHLYYPNRRHPSPAFAALLEELRANSHL
jgi:DNA-binding transcriptional LysR family regulator